jgi:hypothetical protein
MWYIDKTGDYQLELAFAPNDFLNYGAPFAFSVFVIAVLVLFRTRVISITRRLIRSNLLTSFSFRHKSAVSKQGKG